MPTDSVTKKPSKDAFRYRPSGTERLKGDARKVGRAVAMAGSFAGGPAGAVSGVTEAALDPNASPTSMLIAGGLGAIPGVPGVTRNVVSFSKGRLNKLGNQLSKKNDEVEKARASLERTRLEKINRSNALREDTKTLAQATKSLGLSLDSLKKMPADELAMTIRRSRMDTQGGVLRIAKKLQKQANQWDENADWLKSWEKTNESATETLKKLHRERQALIEQMQEVSKIK